jgi:hypothetical protein
MQNTQTVGSSRRRVWWAAGLVIVATGILLWWQLSSRLSGLPLSPGVSPTARAELSRWNWHAKAQNISPGVTVWLSTQKDKTLVSLWRFDFKENPQLEFSIVDADESDSDPMNNRVHHWKRGVGQFVRLLNKTQPRRQVIAISNGAFFGYYSSPGDINGTTFHVSPVVLRGKVFFNTANHRWTWGMKKQGNLRRFDVVHLPSRAQLQQFEYAAGSVQCLIKDKKPLRLEPFPRSKAEIKKQPVVSTPEDVGHIPIFDHMRTCRVSLAWSSDSRYLWWLVVKEPDIESGSAVALEHKLPVSGGWTTEDVQQFWLSLGKEFDIHTAINSDAGDVAQMAWWNGKQYEMIPPRWASNEMKKTLRADFSNAPQGGSVMYYVVSDQKAKSRVLAN